MSIGFASFRITGTTKYIKSEKMSDENAEFWTKMADRNQELNQIKSIQENYKGKIHEYTVSKSLDLYKVLRGMLRKIGYNDVSNAWLKYMEIANYYKLSKRLAKFVEKVDGKPTVEAFFNAELPGSGILAITAYFDLNRIALTWHASSLFPENSNTALTDKYGLYKKYPERWLMNKEENGDMTKISNIRATVKKLGKPAASCWHDAGMELSSYFPEDPDKGYYWQEEINLSLHLGCAFCDLLTLAVGGVFVAKQYSYFTPLNASLIVLYAGLFDEFYICKPKTSRPANTEIYLIGIGYRGMNKDADRILSAALESVAGGENQGLGPKTIERHEFAPILDLSSRDIDELNASLSIFKQQEDAIKRLNTALDKYASANAKVVDGFIKKMKDAEHAASTAWIKENIKKLKK
jgi:hypothetical protein